jgi:hypothetical protein
MPIAPFLLIFAATCSTSSGMPETGSGPTDLEAEAPPPAAVTMPEADATGIGPPETGLGLTGAEAERFLAAAEVVKLENYDTKGITKPRKATLTLDGQTQHAVFKDIDLLHKKVKLTTGKTLLNLYDSYKHEIAAYELAKLLDMDFVPPCVSRKIRGTDGSLCMWVEGAMTQAERRNKGIDPPNMVAYNNQMHDIKLFLQLTWDTDYNNISNNIIDGNWKVYKIDSSRSFRGDPNLRRPATLSRFRRSSVEALRNLQQEELTEAMSPWLSKKAINSLWERRNKLLEVIQDRIDTNTEAAALFD